MVEKAGRRRFTAKYKLGVLEEADRCEPGEIGALLRREGLYSSHLTTWRRQREAGALAGLTPRKRGRKAQPRLPKAQRVGGVGARERAAAPAPGPGRDHHRGPKKSLAAAGDRPEPVGERRQALMAAAETLGNQVGVARACRTLGVARAQPLPAARTHRGAQPSRRQRARRHRSSSRPEERDNALDILHCERFVDASPHTVHATLLDEGQYLCSVRTMYRILAAEDQLRERRTPAPAPPATPNPNCWPPPRTKSGPGTSPSSRGRASGPTSTST